MFVAVRVPDEKLNPRAVWNPDGAVVDVEFAIVNEAADGTEHIVAAVALLDAAPYPFELVPCVLFNVFFARRAIV